MTELSNPFASRRQRQPTPGAPPPVPIEQKLFQKRPTPISSPPSSSSAAPQLDPPHIDAPAPSTDGKPTPAPTATRRFNLRDQPLYKNSFVFTQAEEEALEDLKLELRR